MAAMEKQTSPLQRSRDRDAAAVEAMMAVIYARGQAELVVTGISMLPFLHPERDRVILEAVHADRLRVGDIVFFTRGPGVYVLHRIRRRLKDHALLICGDNQAWTERILPEQILARVSAVRRGTGRVVSCGSASWRLASALWYPTRPLRPLLFSAACRLLRHRKRDRSLRF